MRVHVCECECEREGECVCVCVCEREKEWVELDGVVREGFGEWACPRKICLSDTPFCLILLHFNWYFQEKCSARKKKVESICFCFSFLLSLKDLSLII